MRRLPWDQYGRNRASHAYAKQHDMLGLMAAIETGRDFWDGCPRRVRFMPPCVFRRRPL
jgi:hypothetical protein